VHVDLRAATRLDDGAAASSVRRRLSALSSFYRYCAAHDLTGRVPADGVARPVVDPDYTATAGWTGARPAPWPPPAGLPPAAAPGDHAARAATRCPSALAQINAHQMIPGEYWRGPDRRPEHRPVITTGATRPPKRDAEASTTTQMKPAGATPRGPRARTSALWIR